LVAEAGEAVGGLGVEGELEELVCFAASAFPPVDVADGREDRCCMFGAGAGVGVQEQLLCPLDALPFRGGFGLGEEDLLHGLVDPWDVCNQPVTDGRELQVCENLNRTSKWCRAGF
jgi:hypothetical protein